MDNSSPTASGRGDNSSPAVQGSGDLLSIRMETVLSRFPIHDLSKGKAARSHTKIEIRDQYLYGQAVALWKVTYNSEYGQPGQDGYKLDTLIVNRRIEEAIEEHGRPIPKLIKLGSLRDLCRELDLNEGQATRQIKTALLANASAFVTAKLTYTGNDRGKTERTVEAGFTRYSVIFTGEQLPDGRKADGVYLVLNEIYAEVINHARTRPLDYDYLRSLSPTAARFYEIVSYALYGALLNRNACAKIAYSEYCALSTQTRHFEWDKAKKQLYKVHLPHKLSGYIAKVEFENAVDSEGNPDWIMRYYPGPNASREFNAFKGGGNRAVQRLRGGGQVPHGREAASPDLLLPFAEPSAHQQLTLEQQSNLDQEAAPDHGAASDAEPAAPPKPSAVGPAPEELMECYALLLGNRMSRKIAVELCTAPLSEPVLTAEQRISRIKRQIALLPGRPNTSVGTLVASIRENWDAPALSGEQQTRQEAEAEQQQARARAALAKARQSHQEGHREAYLAYCGVREGELRKEAPVAFQGFLEDEEGQRQNMERIKLPTRMFNSPGQHFLRMRQAFPDAVLDFWQWDEEMNPSRFSEKKK